MKIVKINIEKSSHLFYVLFCTRVLYFLWIGHAYPSVQNNHIKYEQVVRYISKLVKHKLSSFLIYKNEILGYLVQGDNSTMVPVSVPVPLPIDHPLHELHSVLTIIRVF
jgi:hypothetical protein